MAKQNAFQKLYLASVDSLSHLVARIVPPSDVEDIVQETYVRLCQVKSTTEIKSPKSFMYTTARNLALDYKKQAAVRLVDGVGDWQEFEWLLNSNPTDQISDQYQITEEFGELCQAIRLLPVQTRKVFVLKKVYGYSQREIAQKLGLSESTVEKQVASGTVRCMQYFRQQNRIPDNGQGKKGEAK